MNNKRNKKNIFKRIFTFLGATFTAIACCFILNKPSEEINVYADTVETYYTYSSSNLYIPIARTQAQKSLDYLVLKMYITGGDTVKMVFDCDMFYNNGWVGDVPDLSNYYYWQDVNVLDKNLNGVNRTLYATDVQDYAYFYIHDGNYGWRYDFYYRTVGTFTGNVSHIRLDSFVASNGVTGYNRITFFSSPGQYLVLWFSVGDFSNNNGLLSQRDYYLNNPANYSDNENYQFGYNQGTSDGFSNGYTQGENAGYKNGYNVGKNEGYNLGYNQGLDGSGRWSFKSFFASIIDVPVNAFSSLFNFDILGVNLSGFFLGLLTCCVVLKVVRLIFGG